MTDRASPSSDSSECSQPVNCVTALRQLWDYLDGELTSERLEAIRKHIEICSRCFPSYDFEKMFLEAISATRPECRAPERLRDKIEAALREAGFGGRCPR